MTKTLNLTLHEEVKRRNREQMRLSRALRNQPKPEKPEETPASQFSTKQSRNRSSR